MERNKTCCFTGHRSILIENVRIVERRLKLVIDRLVNMGFTNFLCGGALGFDTLAAEAVICARENNSDIRLILALPCKNQAERWSYSQIQRYEMIKSLADEIIFVSQTYTKGCMQKRNRFLVDNSRYCICYLDKYTGGTYYTVKYALNEDLTVYNILTNKLLNKFTDIYE